MFFFSFFFIILYLLKGEKKLKGIQTFEDFQLKYYSLYWLVLIFQMFFRNFQVGFVYRQFYLTAMELSNRIPIIR